MASIEIAGLTKRFGKITAVDRVSFRVEPGQVVGFLGPNGAGKTTTLRMLLGLVAPTTGTATINGRRYAELDRPPHTVGAALEASGAYPGRSARNHLRVEALAAEVSRNRVEEVLDLVELSAAAHRRVGGYSLGMRQRLGLATALLADPKILILDEPANGLDPEGVRWLRHLLREFADRGGTVLVSSHILAEVAQTVDSVVIMKQGRLVTNATLDELASRAERRVRVQSPQSARLGELLAGRGASVTPLTSEQLQVIGLSTEQIGTLAAQHAIPLFETVTEGDQLEDVFLQLTTSTADTDRADREGAIR
jgi:ABC-2 type transport system ATP-binding protein